MDINKFLNLEPMKYYDKDADDLSPNLQKKRLDIINNVNDEYVASEKHDGEWAMFIRGENDDEIFIRSRSKGVNGHYGDFTPKLPHLVEEIKQWPHNTVLLGEICVRGANHTSRDVGTILRCLPAKAIERQKDNPLIVYLFDALYIKDKDFTSVAYATRLMILSCEFNWCRYFKLTDFFDSDFADAADRIIAKGGEGIVIQRKDNPYLAGTRTAWKTLKLKQKLPIMELKVVDIVKPQRDYKGINPEGWNYWEGMYTDTGKTVRINHAPGNIDMEARLEWYPITKPYYFDRAVGVIVDYNGVLVSITSGCTDELGDYLMTEEAQNLIKNGLLFAQVKAMMTSQNGALRHPVLVDIRTMDDQMKK